MANRASWILAPVLLAAAPALADIEDESDGCVYERVVYPEGSELCQNGNLVKCEDGAWSDMGDCRVQAPPAPPPDEGGDVEEPER